MLGKSKVMVFERREVEVVDFNTFYRTSVPAVRRRENGGSERVSIWELLCKQLSERSM